ncbi:MAG TPA: acyloxyacyl hydrolase [Stellaceae bacterium]|nr:acyloxyacyl hydrolase [Stellaceae bacterium]
MRLSTITMRTLLAVAAIIAALAARPAAAQLSLGSPGEPPRLELGGGVYDITPSTRKNAGVQGDLLGEYHFGDVLWIFSPFVGAQVTTGGGTYAYFGFGFDVNYGPWVLTPNAAAGFYQPGGGTPLGSWWEYKTGVELDYKFVDLTRLGIAIHHMSNAGITRINPGEQEIEVVYSIPLRW